VPNSSALHRPSVVTFDCWATLITETESRSAPTARARIVADFVDADAARIRAALDAAWRQHQTFWHRRRAFTGADMTRMTLEMLGVDLDAARLRELTEKLEEEVLDHEIRALSGSRDSLERLVAQGVRCALICDTGYTPGRVVRKLLERVGLLQYLEVTIFSDEIGVPKPHARAFAGALDALGVPPSRAVHVGDLRRSDIAGARAFGMGSVRITLHHDDAEWGPGVNAGVIDCATAGCAPPCERPEADAVVGTYSELMRALGYG
jgi:FMN phosphatase YigB (HAD superfamily)